MHSISKTIDVFPFILLFTLISNIAHSQNTTEPVTTEPHTSTEFFTTEDLSTTIELKGDESILVQITVTLAAEGVDKAWVRRNERALIQVMKSSIGADEGVEVIIGEIKEIYAEENNNNRRVLASVLVGVEIEYLIVINEPKTLNLLESSVETGSFDREFQTDIDATFTDLDITVEETSYENQGVGDPDEFLGKSPATFAELIVSEYIILGLVCSVAGIVWLVFLQTDLSNDYPTYVPLPGNAGGRNSVELVQQASTVSADGGDTTK